MEERSGMAVSAVLNETRHLRRFLETQSPFKGIKKGSKWMSTNANNGKPLLKGQFLTFSRMLKQFRPFYFELQPGGWLVKYQDKTKAPPVETLECQLCTVSEENEVVGDSSIFAIILANADDGEISKLVTEKISTHKIWLKALKKLCRLPQFMNRYKVEQRIFDHFYRCIDKKKKLYASVKIVNKKGLKPEQKRFVVSEISLLRRVQCNLLPKLKKVYEDENYIYLTFAGFSGDDLLKISCSSSLEEIAVATLTYHILKGLRSLHSQGVFHGNLKLENIIFSTGQRENEIFLINFKYLDESSDEYRERLIKRGQNNYVAPEVLNGEDITSQIDIFALGVCIFYMLFQKYPYKQITRTSDSWRYELDLSVLTSMLDQKKRDPSSHQQLSVSGIDFLMKLLLEDPNKRLDTATALNHHWFINFTNKPSENKKLQKFREAHQMTSLKTILECSEISEREVDSASRLFFRRPITSNMSVFSNERVPTIPNIFSSQHGQQSQAISQFLSESPTLRNTNSILGNMANYSSSSNLHLNSNQFNQGLNSKNLQFLPILETNENNNDNRDFAIEPDEISQEEERVVERLMMGLEKITLPKLPSKTFRRSGQSLQENYLHAEYRVTSPLEEEHASNAKQQDDRIRSYSTEHVIFRSRVFSQNQQTEQDHSSFRSYEKNLEFINNNSNMNTNATANTTAVRESA